jgi:hypothetical protein
VQYGENARSISLYLHLYQLLPVARTAEAMRDLFACPMSRQPFNAPPADAAKNRFAANNQSKPLSVTRL